MKRERKLNKTFTALLLVMAMVIVTAGCGKQSRDVSAVEETESQQKQENPLSESADQVQEMVMMIGNQAVPVEWEDNESVDALQKLCATTPLTIQMSMYGGFEQVGSIGQSLPKNDKQTTTHAGDIVLYSGSNIVVFYGSNSWSYTRLGRISGLSEADLTEMLGNGNVTITISMDSKAE